MSRIVITGAAGFIGRHLAARLSSEGHEVIGLVRRPPGSTDGSPVFTVSGGTVAPPPGACRAIVADLLDRGAIGPHLRGADWCIHLAGAIEARRREEYRRSNVLVTRRLLEACRDAGQGRMRFLHFSSVAAQGPCYEGRPMREGDPCRPESEYGRSKEEAERLCRRFQRDVPVTIVRPAFVYGRGDQRGLAMIRSLYGPGAASYLSRIRTIGLCHVSDLVDACRKVLSAGLSSGSIFLVSDGEAHTPAGLRDLLRPMLFPAMPERPAAAPAVSERMQDWACDITRAREALGFVPRIRLADGAGDTIEWYRESGWLPAQVQAPREAE